MEMMLQTQNLCKYFKKQKAVNNVSLNIEKGQIYGLLGPNRTGYKGEYVSDDTQYRNYLSKRFRCKNGR